MEVDKNDGDGSGWELSKENIQPLSSGRKMSVLCHSLEKADEAETAKLKRELEEQIESYSGPDPLEPWLRYIDFLEQTCPTGGKMNAYYEGMLNKCFKTFFNTASYKNDKRYIDVMIKALQNFSPTKRYQFVHGIWSKGIGAQVSKVYLTMADDLEAIQNYQEADRVLRRGIEADAQPIEYLHDALANLQYRVAERVSKNFQKENEDLIRNFGSSVPVCKFTNEAQNVRVALSPGNPCRAKPVSNRADSKKIPIFQGFNSKEDEENNVDIDAKSGVVLPLQHQDMIRSDQENNTKPKKWCNEMLPPQPVSFASNQEPIQIYVDEPEIQPNTVSLQHNVSKKVLSERKLPPVDDLRPMPAIPQETVTYRKNQLFQGRDREITFEHLRSKAYLKNRGLNTIRALVTIGKKTEPRIARLGESNLSSSTPVLSSAGPSVENQAFQKADNFNPSYFSTAKPQYSDSQPNSQVQRSTREEALAKEVAALEKKLQETECTISDLKIRNAQSRDVIEQQNARIGQMEESLNKFREAAENEIIGVQQEKMHILSRFEEQERELARSEEENSQLRQIVNQERSINEVLRKEREAMQQQFEEEKMKMQQDFDRERNESLLSFKFDHHRSISILQEEEKFTQVAVVVDPRRESMIASPSRGRTPGLVVAKPPVQQKLGFTLYESNIGDIVNDGLENTESLPRAPQWAPNAFPGPAKDPNLIGSGSGLGATYPFLSSLNLKDDFAMPPPPPKSQNKIQEEDKENMSTDGHAVLKPNRPLSGVLLPSSSAEPMEMIFMEEEENDDDVLKKQEDTGIDFNVTDLTRALEFYPKPLVNSTPEKVDRDRTCYLPVNAMVTKRRRPFANLDLEALRKPEEAAVPVEPEETNLKNDFELMVYDDENNVGNPKENSFSFKSYGQSYVNQEHVHHNLSPIQEASKERWSSGTSSSSSNMTRGTVNFSVGSSYNSTKSVPRVGRFPNSQRGPGPSDTFQPTRYGSSYTFENHSQNQPS